MQQLPVHLYIYYTGGNGTIFSAKVVEIMEQFSVELYIIIVVERCNNFQYTYYTVRNGTISSKWWKQLTE